jgi:hypothetical protein
MVLFLEVPGSEDAFVEAVGYEAASTNTSLEVICITSHYRGGF